MHISTRVFEISRKTCKRCMLLFTNNSVVCVVVIGLVLGQSLMVISTMGILLFAKISSLYNVLWECIVVVYT